MPLLPDGEKELSKALNPKLLLEPPTFSAFSFNVSGPLGVMFVNAEALGCCTVL